MAKPLTAEQIAIVCAMRDEGATLGECGLAIHRDYRPVGAALEAAGYDTSRKAGITGTPERRKRALDLYMVDGLSLRKVAREMGVHDRIVRLWIVEGGGEIRSKPRKATPGSKSKTHRNYTRWAVDKACPIGAFIAPGETTGYGAPSIGSNYCAEECDWTNCYSVKPCEFLHGFSHRCLNEDIPCDSRVDMCDDEMTDENRAGFEQYKATRAEHERKRVADPKRGAGGFDMLAMWGGAE